ncbi:hypothetical protein [Sagittula sp. SSi028]|uniref:hypothetical protein n=1 Tax=Sagittula sp. SSi028 TaxID=3400636 RepID=UPI003AF52A9A
MATDAAVMMAAAIMSMILPLTALKLLVKRVVRRTRGDDVAERRDDAARAAIVCCSALAMAASVYLVGPDVIGTDLVAAR